ncbi:hypothetical protein PROFUN_09783 [Planoprotostelium fungivorum]|uniref:non-specific serine/threonine protein kinase n=1 Tax=Planoprotostelium fungivorum TaxID=1890364 RepID=A0A2P6NGM3_9EUKA|nr:hypothetical protein PROFUN_09783 [Planoprotostelium fungivorum]
MTEANDEFVVEKCLAKSPASEILLCHDKTGRRVVLKKIHRLKVEKELLASEIDAARTLQHPSIIRVSDDFQEGMYHYLVMEYVKGQDLFALISERKFVPFKEKDARKIFKQIVKAVQYVHEQHFAHRDLKMENIIMNENGRIKIIDFGLCCRTEEGKLYNKWCGSQDYCCPEILQKQPYNGQACDVWSLGVVLYILLYAELPFGFKTRVKAVLKGQPHPPLNFADKRNPNKVSEEAKNLISGMLQVESEKRMTLEQVAKHPWIKERTTFGCIVGRLLL